MLHRVQSVRPPYLVFSRLLVYLACPRPPVDIITCERVTMTQTSAVETMIPPSLPQLLLGKVMRHALPRLLSLLNCLLPRINLEMISAHPNSQERRT